MLSVLEFQSHPVAMAAAKKAFGKWKASPPEGQDINIAMSDDASGKTGAFAYINWHVL